MAVHVSAFHPRCHSPVVKLTTSAVPGVIGSRVAIVVVILDVDVFVWLSLHNTTTLQTISISRFICVAKKIGLTLPTKPPLFALRASTRCHTRSTALPYVRTRLLSPTGRSCRPALSSTIHIARTCSRPIEALAPLLHPAAAAASSIYLPHPPAPSSMLRILVYVPLSVPLSLSTLSGCHCLTLLPCDPFQFYDFTVALRFYALWGVLPLWPVTSLVVCDPPCGLWPALWPALGTHTPTYRPSPTPYHPPPRISIFTSFSLFQFFTTFLCHFTPIRVTF